MSAEAARIWRCALDHLARQPHPTWLHGPEHWCRVERNGLWLCRQSGPAPQDPAFAAGVLAADEIELIVRLFAACHDAARNNDGPDPRHGPRAAEFLLTWQPQLSTLALQQLQMAVAIHTAAQPPRPLPWAVQLCLDADRLDIGRVGYPPHPQYLFTAAARDLAHRQAVRSLDAESLPVTHPDLLRPTPA